MSASLAELLKISNAHHSHLCPRQVLGVRMGLTALEILGIESPISKLTGLVILETDGCFADGVQAATGAWVGHRTLRVHDVGKIAATFANIQTGRMIRLSPRMDARIRALLYAPKEVQRYDAQLRGYQVMPAEELLRVEDVTLDPPLEEILSKPGCRAVCEICGEEVINEREIVMDGTVLCRDCAQGSYYVLSNGTRHQRPGAILQTREPLEAGVQKSAGSGDESRL
jgi:formylmethanofuran dehydrogenase subunit E